MYVPYDLSKVKVLDLSQNFSVDSPPFASLACQNNRGYDAARDAPREVTFDCA